MDIEQRINQFLSNDVPTRQELHELEDLLSDAYYIKIIDSEAFHLYTNAIIQKYYREIARRFCKLPDHEMILSNWKEIYDRAFV